MLCNNVAFSTFVPMTQIARKLWSDVVGIISATFCLIHCLILPLFLSATMFQENELLHYTFVAISFIGVLATVWHSKIGWIKVSLLLSFAALLVGSIFEAQLAILFRTGVFGLVLSHVINIYLVQASKNKKALAIN